MGISVNGPSGIDTQYIIEQLVALEQNKVTKIENEQKAYQLKIDAFSKLKSLLTDLRTNALALSEKKSFDLFSSSSSDEDIVTISGGTGSVDASYDLRVFQLASAEKMISADGLIEDQNASLTSLGVGDGIISIDGVEITIDSNDSIQDLRIKINNATDSSGNKLGVSASVVSVSDDNYRLVLASKNTGSNGVEYKDISGNVLNKLGIINADGEKGNVSQELTSSGNVLEKFNALAIGEIIQLSGIDNNGEVVTKSFAKKSDDDGDFLKQIKAAFHNMADVQFDGDGNLVITDEVTGSSQLALNSLKIGSTDFTFNTNRVGVEGEGVLSAGKDAYFSVEGIFMNSDTNTASGFMTGVTFDFHAVSTQKDVRVSLKRDVDGIRDKFQELINSFNAIARFAKDSTKIKDPTDENSTAGVLSGDSTVNNLVSSIRSFFQQNSDLFEGTYTNFTMLGLKTDTKTGEYSLDSEMFDNALNTNLDEVMNLFTKFGTSDNSNIVFGRSTLETKEGKYVLEEVDEDHLRIKLEGTSEWFISDARRGEIISFSDGLVKGLSLTAPNGSIGDGNTATFTFSKGLGTVLDEAIQKLTDSSEGMIALRQESWRRNIQSTDDRVLRMNERVEKYRDRLIKQFSNMEVAMNQMQAQTLNMLNSLGMY